MKPESRWTKPMLWYNNQNSDRIFVRCGLPPF